MFLLSPLLGGRDWEKGAQKVKSLAQGSRITRASLAPCSQDPGHRPYCCWAPRCLGSLALDLSLPLADPFLLHFCSTPSGVGVPSPDSSSSVPFRMLLLYCSLLWGALSIPPALRLAPWVYLSIQDLRSLLYLYCRAYSCTPEPYRPICSLCLECPVLGFSIFDPSHKKYMWHHEPVPTSTWSNARQYLGCCNSDWQHHVLVHVRIQVPGHTS